mmetsp:Transcript_10341/g.18417  ORF Transcript_10341/g.18417 Transcript_10341/m.18417 type:complete len:473 (+) Transcript_10341:133-1551(+)
MLRTSSTPHFRSISECKSEVQPALALPLGMKSFKLKLAPTLDGGRSPFVEQRKEPLKLPMLVLTRNGSSSDCGTEMPTPTPTPTPHGRRVAFSAPGSKKSEPGTPLPLAPVSAPEKSKRPHRVKGRSVGRGEKKVLFQEDGDSGPPQSPLRRKGRRLKTWDGTGGTEVSTPSVIGSGWDSTATTPRTYSGRSPAQQSVPGSFGWSWVKGGTIGSGSHGCVYKALDLDTGHIFAVKTGVVEDSNELDRKYRSRLEKELHVCKDLRHPNIVATLGFDCTPNYMYIYLEYVPGGSMSALLQEFGPLSNSLLRDASAGLVEGLNYLHSQEPPVVHRDIKGANILVDLDFNVKLSDFGCSKRSDVSKSFTTTGSIPWMAPEVIQLEDGYGRKADIWSLGCSMIEMATTEAPWGKTAFENVVYALRHIAMSDELPPIPDTLDAEGHKFISMCLQRDSEARPSASDLRGQAFLCSNLLK